jgi:hypothetical protein
MLRRLALTLTAPAFLALAFLAQTAQAQTGRTEALIEVLRLPEVIEIMREEGRDHGAEIGASLLGRQAGGGWEATVERIYRPARMMAIMVAGLEAALPAEAPLAEMVAFFETDLGRRVVELEIGARRAMLDEAVDEAAREAWARMRLDEDARIPLLRRFVEVGNLVEENVAGGLNSTYAFYMGLLDGGAPEFPMAQGDVLADVMAQEPGIRAEIEEWLFAYLALAFGPLETADLEAYTAFFETEAGRALNTALFAGFHGMFDTISRELGRAAGLMLGGEDL